MLKLRSDIAFDLRNLLTLIPKDQMGEVENSPYKAITMRRKVIERLKDANTAYEGLVERVGEVLKAGQERIKTFEADLESVEGKDEEAKKAEKSVYMQEVDADLVAKLKEIGEVIMVKKGEQSLIMLRSEETIDVDLDDRQMAFLKSRVEKHGPAHFAIEDDLIAAGEALGLE